MTDKFAFTVVSNFLEYFYRHHHQELKSVLPQKVYNVLQNSIQKEAASTLLPSLACAGVAIVAAAIVIMAIYQKDRANAQATKAQFKVDDLKMLLYTEVIPTIQLIGKMLDCDAKTECKRFCSTTTGNKLSSLINTLQNIRNNIEKKLAESTSGKQRSSMMKWASGAVAGVGAMLFALFIWTGVVVGVIGVAAGGAGFTISGNSTLTHQGTMLLLEQARDRAREAEEKLRTASFNIYKICIMHDNQQYLSTESKQSKILLTDVA